MGKNKDRIPTPNVQTSVNKKFHIGIDTPAGVYNNAKFYPVFRFSYINLRGTELCYNNPLVQVDHYHALFEKFKILESKTYQEIRDGGKYFRFHPVDFEDDNVSVTFNTFKKCVCSTPDKVPDDQVPTCYQFDVFHKVRAMGFLGNSGDFYLVWLDANHNIYPGE